MHHPLLSYPFLVFRLDECIRHSLHDKLADGQINQVRLEFQHEHLVGRNESTSDSPTKYDGF